MNFDDRETGAGTALRGRGEMWERVRAFDWSATAAGPAADWPRSLSVSLQLMLDSRYPMFIWWGPRLVNFYNDAYIPVLGKKHPAALGQPAAEVWGDVWETVGAEAEAVFNEGRASWNEEQLLIMERNQFLEETYFTWSYSPILNDENLVAGIFCACTEDTRRVLGRRRMRALGALAEHTTRVTSVSAACESVVAVVDENPHDLPFVLVYLLDGSGEIAELVGAAGLERGHPAAPHTVELAEMGSPWPFAAVAKTGESVVASGLVARFGRLSGGAWPESPERAAIVPLTRAGQAMLSGFAVVGLSPRLAFDDEYREFTQLLANGVAAGIADARVHEGERKRVEALANLDREKTAFFQNVSHEFRTPLTLILGPVEEILARHRQTLPPDAAAQLDLIGRNAVRLLRLVNTLLDFSRIEYGRIRARYEPLDLSEETKRVVDEFRPAIERGGLRLLVDCPPLDEPVFIDSELWGRIVLNLLSNAHKFTTQGDIAVRVRRAGKNAELQVCDTGTGIPQADIPRLFERFYRVENEHARAHEGSGIGLAMVEELVKLHGGAVTVESEVGIGSTFTVGVPFGQAHLPADQIGERGAETTVAGGWNRYLEESLQSHPENDVTEASLSPIEAGGQSSAKEDGGRPRVLVADDNRDMRGYIARLLSGAYHVTAVADGEAALAATRSEAPDLIISDIMMPRLDGFGLLKQLRAGPATREVPVILLTARAGEDSRMDGIDAGAEDYLVKPFNARELLARVRAQLKMARVRREAGDALRTSERRFQEMADTVPAALWLTDAEHGCTFLSRGWFEMTGQPIESGLGLGWLTMVHAADRQHARTTFLNAAGARQHFHIVCRFRSASGEYRWAVDTGRPRFDESGQFVGYIGAVIDDHERKQAEEALKQAHEELEQRVLDRTRELHYRAGQLARLTSELSLTEQRERQRLAQILHDHLQQLLISVKLRLNVRARASGEEDPSELAELAGLVDDAIEASRSLTVELAPPILHDAGLAAGLSWLARWMKKQHGLTVLLDVGEDVVAEREDIRILLFQCVRELLFNVVKHAGVPEARVTVAAIAGEQIRAVVSDSGCGFDPGVALSGGVDSSQGFGLFSIRERIELLGGQFVVESAPGAGARFTLVVPAHSERAQVEVPDAPELPGADSGGDAASAGAAAFPRGAGESVRILIVDDHYVIRDGLRAVLSGEPSVTVVGDAADGVQAIAQSRLHRPDVILMDYSMPNMDGVEATRRIKLELPDTKIIGLSMYDEPDRAAAMIGAGAAAYVTKSGITAVLLDTIQNVWEQPAGGGSGDG